MKRKTGWFLGFILLAAILIRSSSLQSGGRGEVIVKYTGGMPQIDISSEMQLEKQWQFNNKDNETYTLAYFTSNNKNTEELIKYFSKQEGVEYAEPNFKLHITALPDDLYVSRQWYINNDLKDYERSSAVDIGIETLWGSTDTSLEENVVALIDTGVDYTHPDLAAHMWENTTTLPGRHGYNFIDQTDDPMDLLGHGTHCAGIIAAVTNNKIGISGISRNTRIMALKYMDEMGNGLISQAIDAYAYILEAQKQGVNIVAISNSWGDTNNPKALEDIIETAGQNGILSVCAAGNFGVDLDVDKTFPAAYASPYTIVVGASTPDDELASFSCYGKYTVDVTAPGTSILSTYNRDGYLPGLAGTDQMLLTFEDGNMGFKGEHISIADDRSFSGTHSLLWQLQPSPENEIYAEGDQSAEYANALTLEVPAVKANSYFGINFWGEGPVRTDGIIPCCYIDAYVNNLWMNIGILNIGNINFWNTSWFPVNEGVTQLRLVGIGIPEGSRVYFDQIGVGTTTGKYTYLQGTSMAAPMVTGEVAMLTRMFPEETPSQIRARVIGGVDRTMEGLVASDGRINMRRAIENPYAVINSLTQNDNGQIVLLGEFFGSNAGKVTLNNNNLEVASWNNNEIILDYTGDFDGYGSFNIIREDGAASSQLLIVRNPQFNWQEHAPLPVAIKDAAAVAHNDYIYVMGGTRSEEEPSRSVYRYSINEDKWEELASLPEKNSLTSYSYGGSAAALGDYILFVTFDNMYDSNAYFWYSIKDNKWEVLDLKTVPEPRAFFTLTTYNDAIYMIGGIPKGDYSGQEILSRDIWKLNREKTGWEKAASLNEGRYAPIAAVAGNQLIVTGGRTGDTNYLTSTEVFNGKDLIRGAELPFGGVYSQNTVFGGGEKLYVMTDGTSFDAPGLVYSPDTNTWKNSVYRLGYGRSTGVGSATNRNQLYAIGGEEDYRTVQTLRSIEIEEAAGQNHYKIAFIVGVIVLVIVILVILITIWVRKNKKPKKMYIR